MNALRTAWQCGGMRRHEDKLLPHEQCGAKLMKLLSLHLEIWIGTWVSPALILTFYIKSNSATLLAS